MVFGFGLLSPNTAANIRINYAYADAHKGLYQQLLKSLLTETETWLSPTAQFTAWQIRRISCGFQAFHLP